MAMSLRHPLALPVSFVYATHGPYELGWRVGDHKLGDACDSVPNPGVAAWPATSLAEAKPDCIVLVATRRSRWSVRLRCTRKTDRRGTTASDIPRERRGTTQALCCSEVWTGNLARHLFSCFTSHFLMSH